MEQIYVVWRLSLTNNFSIMLIINGYNGNCRFCIETKPYNCSNFSLNQTSTLVATSYIYVCIFIWYYVVYIYIYIYTLFVHTRWVSLAEEVHVWTFPRWMFHISCVYDIHHWEVAINIHVMHCVTLWSSLSGVMR